MRTVRNMKTGCTAWCAAVVLMAGLAPVAQAAKTATAATASDSAAARQVDALLARWNKADSPGCAIAVIHNGKVIYRRGVGMADLERDAKIGPDTPFHIASMSKQFTAMAVHLLAQDGKLSLDDDIRKYLPELHDFGKPITIAHLLHHTSGLRDQWNLLALAGWRLEDVITEDDIFSVLQRQTALNFAPGAKFSYSNSGYTLLGMIVKRVSGQPLPAFVEQRILAPLGMKHTHFHDNYGTLVKGRALSYGPSTTPGRGYEYVALSYSNVGATSLFSTVDDLALWDRNFYDGKVGGKALLAQMQTPGILNDGKPTGYGSGLGIGEYRGLKTVAHSGADAGYRSEMLRFPEQGFSVAVLANAGDFDVTKLSRQVADIYLAAQLKPLADAPKKAAPVEVPLDAARLDAFVGEFALTPQFSLRFTKQDGRLMSQGTGQEKVPMFASGERDFFLKVVDARISFDAPDKDGVVNAMVLHQNGRDNPGKRIERAPMSDAQLGAYEGEYYSRELHVLYTLKARNGQLVLNYPRGELVLDPVETNVFAAQFPLGRISYRCRPEGGCSGFTIDNGRVRQLVFEKVTVNPTSL